MKPKHSSRRSVKADPKTTQQQLQTLLAQLSTMKVDWSRVEQHEPHTWYGVLSSDWDRSHPAHDAAHTLLQSHPRLSKQLKQSRALTQAFIAALPQPCVEPFLELDRVKLEASLAECVAHYHVGVVHGRESKVVERALDEGGIDIKAVPTGTLFLMTRILATLAHQLPLDGCDQMRVIEGRSTR